MNMLPSALLVEDEIDVADGFEWIDGQAVEKTPMGLEAGLVNAKLLGRLQHHVESNNLGFVFTPDVGYQIPVGSSRRVRKPDLSFVARGRFPEDRVPRGNSTIAPDLAVEVISPNDVAEDIEQRIADFLSVGTRLF